MLVGVLYSVLCPGGPSIVKPNRDSRERPAYQSRIGAKG